MLKFHSPPPWGRLTSYGHRAPVLVLLDRNAALADLDFDAGGLLVLIDQVADDGGADGEDGDELLSVMPDLIRHPAGERPRAGKPLAARANRSLPRLQTQALLDPGSRPG